MASRVRSERLSTANGQSGVDDVTSEGHSAAVAGATNSRGGDPSIGVASERVKRLGECIEHAAHFLPSQGPLTVFIHHNTLHAFEKLPFEKAVVAAGEMYGCEAFLSESRYKSKLALGRIRVSDLEAALSQDLGAMAAEPVGRFATRRSLRLEMLKTALRYGTKEELGWVVAVGDGLKKFCPDAPSTALSKIIEETKLWATRDRLAVARGGLGALEEFKVGKVEGWTESQWESFSLRLLWHVITSRLESLDAKPPETVCRKSWPRDIVLKRTGEDAFLVTHDWVIRFWSAFLDQGFSNWEMPHRDLGAFRVFLELATVSLSAPTRFASALRREARRISESGMTALQCVSESLEALGITRDEEAVFIEDTLLALRGWAGMVWQMETNAPWEPHPAPKGSLVDFLAIRLILDRITLDQTARSIPEYDGDLASLRNLASKARDVERGEDSFQRAFTLFELSQHQGWTPESLATSSDADFYKLVEEVGAFSSLDRRRIYHLAFERKYRNETFDALMSHGRWRSANALRQPKAEFQVVCCIDEREESFRRHLEEIDPSCETLGVAGFFGVAMYYRGLEDAHFRPLCPVNVEPDHYVVEEPMYSVRQWEERRTRARRRLGRFAHTTHRGSRTFLLGFISGLTGAMAVFPLVARTIFPRTTSRLVRAFGGVVKAPATELRLERSAEAPGSQGESIGYSVEEMADIVEGGLRAIGLSQPERFSRMVVICGHGSSSLNNPHEAAHDCGACGGGRGGPNARAFCKMANDPRVRDLLARRGLALPETTIFVGSYHNTCDDSVEWYDLDYIPRSHRPLFETARNAVDEARTMSAHERCRRFESAGLDISPQEGLQHVERRAEDLSQPRPEYGHCTNALCFVGRRDWSRGLFLDRRAFLTSYDPAQDDEQSSILRGLLSAVIPVCAGINLEYYFSYVDPSGYGCGTKLPHNITSLLGVMDGASSDLRPGLPWQMVELHEPVRILFVIETTREALTRIIDSNPAIAQLVKGYWVQVAIYDAKENRIDRWIDGKFERYESKEGEIPVVNRSIDWYRGQRGFLGFASVMEPWRAEGAES